ncbi:MAG: methionine--tRNA ligase subunit beta [Atopobiaceae bacterium]
MAEEPSNQAAATQAAQTQPTNEAQVETPAAATAQAADDQAVDQQGAVEPAGPQIEPVAEAIDFDTFSKSDMRVCKVLECTAVKKSKKLLQFTLDDGSGTHRTILSGIHKYYEPEELVGKTVLAIVNIPPRKMMGIDSCGMLLSAVYQQDGQEHLHLVMLDDAIPAGAKLY